MLQRFFESSMLSPIKSADPELDYTAQERLWIVEDISTTATDLYGTLQSASTGHTMTLHSSDKSLNSDSTLSSNFEDMSYAAEKSTPGWREKEFGRGLSSSEESLEEEKHSKKLKKMASKDLSDKF